MAVLLRLSSRSRSSGTQSIFVKDVVAFKLCGNRKSSLGWRTGTQSTGPRQRLLAQRICGVSRQHPGLLRVSKFMTARVSGSVCVPMQGYWLHTVVRPGAWGGQLRGCPPAFGLLLDAAAPPTPNTRTSSRSGIWRRTTRHAGAGQWCAQRSGIKEELSAPGRQGGQPRS